MVESDQDRSASAADISSGRCEDRAEMQTRDIEEKSPLEEQDGDRMKKWIVTLLFCLLNVGGGTLIVVIGSVLLDLQILTTTNSSQIAWIFPAKSLGLLAGIVGIKLFFKDCLAVIVLVMSWIFAVSVTLTSFFTNLYCLIALLFVQGMSVVCIWVGGTLSMAAIWGKEKATALYILSFGLYSGFFIGPALAYNFTSKHYGKYFDKKGHNVERVNDTVTFANGTNITEVDNYHPDVGEIQWKLFLLFLMIGVEVAIFGTLTYIGCLCLGSEKLRPPKDGIEDSGNHRVQARPCIAWFLIVIAAIVQFIGDGQVNSTVGSYLKSYVMLYMNLSKAQATIIALAFNGTYVAWTGFGAFFQRRFGPTWSFYVMAQSNILGTTIMYFSGNQFIPFCVGIAFLGIGLSAKSSALICWVTDKVGMVSQVTFATYAAWALGDMFQATLIGNLFDSDPHTFAYVLFGGSCLFFLSFVVGQLGYTLLMKEPGDSSCCFKKKDYAQMK